MLTFIDDSRDRAEYNGATLYYSIFDGTHWSTPKAVADDGTPDSIHTLKKIGDKVIIAWTDVKDAFAGGKLQEKSFHQSVFLCNIRYKNQQMGEETSIVLTTDTFTLIHKIDVDGDMLYISYVKLDVSKLGNSNSDLLQLEKSFSNIAYVKYDMNTGKSYDETIIPIPHKTISSPIALDYNSAIININNESYLISEVTLLMKTKTDYKLGDDRELYLQIQNLTTGQAYFPIQITNDSISNSLPKLTNINGELYLTWLDNGYMFKIMNLSDMLSSMFNADSNGDMTDVINADTVNSAYKNGEMTDDNKNADWYKKTAAELGMSDDVYENSIYEALYNGTFNVTSANFQGNDDLCTSIGNYIVTSNGEDIYIYYTELSQDSKKNGTGKYIWCTLSARHR